MNDDAHSPRSATASLAISVAAIIVTLVGPMSGLVTLGGLFIPVGVAKHSFSPARRPALPTRLQ